ncbi:MAG: hypothetical protein Q7U48_15510 [Hydrogenophaga sp.]|nr:hypothetical protein [Hydrogenophaga sp.]
MTNIKKSINTFGENNPILHGDVSSTAFLYRGTDTDAWLHINMDGDVHPDSVSNSTTVPISVWTRETLRLPLPSNISAKALHRWLEEAKTQNLLETVHNGHNLQFDRQRQCDIWSLSDEAEEALNTLEQEANELDTLEVWDAEDWLIDSTLQTLWPAGITLQQAIEKLAIEIIEREVHIDGDLSDVLLMRAIEEANEGQVLSREQLMAIMQAERGDELLDV